MLKAIIFDFSGVVFREGFFSALESIAEKYGIEKEEFKKIIREKYFFDLILGKITEDDFVQGMIKEYPQIPIKDKERIKETMRVGFEPITPMLELAGKLRKKYKTLLLTMICKGWLDRAMTLYDMTKVFDFIVTSYEEKLTKKQPEFYIAAAKKAGVKPEECLYVEDQEANIEFAKKAGMQILKVDSVEQAINDLKEYL